MKETVIEFKNVSFQYKNQSAPTLVNVTGAIKQGECIGIIGLSGTGKSTLMNLINGVIPYDIKGELQGDVTICEKNSKELSIEDRALLIGTVFQDPDTQIVFSTVEDEIAFGPENLCIEPDIIKQRIDHILKMLNIEALRFANPNHLSGGQKQMVVLASILSLAPKIIILDECMTQVDKTGRSMILSAIKTLKQEGVTIFMVEHEMENLTLADRIIYIESDGTVTWDHSLK